MKENDYLLNLSAVKWEDYDFEKDTNIHEQGFRSLDSNYLCDVLFLEQISKKAKKLGYVVEHHLDTLDYEKYDEKFPPYERLWAFSKTDEQFPEEMIGIYRSFKYRAEGISSMDSTSHGLIIVKNSMPHAVLRMSEIVKEHYQKYVNMFCGKKGYNGDRDYEKYAVKSIVIVVVDEINDNLLKILAHYHKPYILFCVIVTSEREKIWIGNDVRRFKNKDDNSYFEKIKELEYLLSD